MRFYVKLDTDKFIYKIPGISWILKKFRVWSVYDVDKQRYTHHKSTYYNACKYRDYYEDLYR